MHPSVNQSLYHLYLVKVVRKAKFDGTRLIQCQHLFWSEVECQAGKIILQLRNPPRPNDRNHWNIAISQPSQGYLSLRTPPSPR